ncbi:hypothetical protein [Thauera linaloolentis]|uniref:hypothetical protein n=1 Tax=Thauera linaloolentis TaxID=76112 RepID=UPI000AC67E61|nr:hypothetical protein [Thauera linaloolentis]MCM8566004.1 hypothetical protein [Thauera linaloolentis]
MKQTIVHMALAITAACVAAPTVFAQTSAVSAGQAETSQKSTRIHEGLSSPVGMAYDASGNLYIANWSAGTVLRFAPDGKRSVFAEGLSGPSGLAISTAGDIYVASYSEDLVWRFTPAGDQSIFVRGLATPAGLSFDARGRLLIANRRTNQILAAHPDGKIDVVAEGLQTPVGAVELPNGDLLVSNIAGGISLVSGAPRARTINSDLGSPGPGIVLSPTGTLEPVDDRHNGATA